MSSLVVANYNLHAGMNGWGQPFDVIKACRTIDADVLVLEEAFGEIGQASQPEQVAWELGYHLIEEPLERVIFRERHDERSHQRWGPRPLVQSVASPLIAEHVAERYAKRSGSVPPEPPRRGHTGIAVLSRWPILESKVIELPKIHKDTLPRRAIAVVLGEDRPIRVIGTHLGHLTHGSPRQMLALRKIIREQRMPSIAIGDMNCWGPPLRAIVGGHDAVSGATWPAWRPHSRIDHILLSGGAHATSGEVLEHLGSDHLPIRATITW